MYRLQCDLTMVLMRLDVLIQKPTPHPRIIHPQPWVVPPHVWPPYPDHPDPNPNVIDTSGFDRALEEGRLQVNALVTSMQDGVQRALQDVMSVTKGWVETMAPRVKVRGLAAAACML